MLRTWLHRHPRLKQAAITLRDRLRGGRLVSSHYAELDGEAAEHEANRLRGSWQAGELPRRQRQLVDPQLARYRKGQAIPVFDVAVEAVGAALVEGRTTTVVEIGCSSGFYSEVFEIAGLPVAYSGADYSPAFIDLARKTYPGVPFEVADATALPYADAAYDVLISGCCLLHIPDYEAAIAESSRVARSHVLFHRTPVLPGSMNRTFTKLAYGIETVEIHFGEKALLDMFARHGLSVVGTWVLSEEPSGAAVRSYLCTKIMTA